MAGLLDGFDLSDPTTQGLLSAAAQMFQASGPSRTPVSLGQVLGQGYAGGAQAYTSAKKTALDQQLERAKLAMAQLQEQRASQLFDLQKKAYNEQDGSSTPQSIGPDLSSAMSAQGQIGPTNQRAALIPQQTNQTQSNPQTDFARQANMLSRQAIIGIPGVKDRFDILKALNDPMQLAAGNTYVDRATGKERYISALDKGQTRDTNGNVILEPGYLDALRSTTSTQKGAEQQAVNANTLLDPEKYRTQGGIAPGTTVGQFINQGQPDLPTSLPQGASSGLDLTKLPPQVISALAKADPQAFARGVQDFQKTQPTQEKQTLSLPSWAIPSPSGGYVTPSQKLEEEQAVKLKTQPILDFQNQGANASRATEKDINTQAETAADFAKRIQNMQQVMNFDSNSATPMRSQMAAYANSLGLPDKVVNGIAGGNLSDIQTFKKMAVTNSMEALKSDMQSGRITQAEFQIYKENNPNVELLRQATNNILSRAQEKNQLALDKQQAYTQYKNDSLSKGQIPDNFPAYWNQQLQQSGKVGTQMPANAMPQNKIISLSDIQETARQSGKTTAEVTAAAKAKGYRIGGQ